MRITAHYSRSIYSVISLAANSYKIFITKDGAGINAFCLQNTNTRPRSSARRLYPLHSLPLFRVGGRSWGTFSFHSFFALCYCTFCTPIPLALTHNQFAYALPIRTKLQYHYTPTTAWDLVRTNKQREPYLLSYCFRGYAFNDLHADTTLRLFRAVLGLAICAESVIRPLLLFDFPPMPLLTIRSLVRHSFVLLRTRSLACLPPPYSVG
jgi:hypothetical protein